jgi:2-polyprenyl-6-methoxyphenol hydroxylase-like FAD-dependent oxidoreductase
VLVVGAGPVGLSTAMFLAHWGVRSLVIDKRDPTTAPPRAGASLRTLELFRSIGLGPVLDEVGWLGAPPMCSVFKDSAFGATHHHSGLPPSYAERLDTCSPVDARLQLTQVEVQRMALDYLDGGVRFGVGLLGFDADDTGVRARTTAGEITAQYLVGADGANSGVRDALGITMPDRTVVARLNTAFFRADLGDVVTEWGTHACFVRNENVFATLFSKNGRDQWSSHVMDYPGKPDGLTELSPDRTVELLRAAIGRPVPIELHAVNAWEAALGIASAFRRGRVFLAGDAAHVQSSAGGLGMNTGIQDGHNLAWKLAAAVNGDTDLLDTYEPERRAAAEASLRLSRRMHEGYQTQVADPDRMYEEIAVDYLRGMMFHGQPDVLTDEVRPGCRFPHRWVAPGVSTLDLLGTRWTRLTGDEEWLRVTQLSVEGPVSVRPDGFVE